MRGALQFIGMMIRGCVLLSAVGAFVYCMLNGASLIDLAIIFSGFAFTFADTVYQAIHIAKGWGKTKKERLYLVNFHFDGGQGVKIIRASGVNEHTQEQVHSAFWEKIEQGNPDLGRIFLSSISEVPGK